MNSSQVIVLLQQESQLFNRVKSSLLAAHLGQASRVKLTPGQILLTPEKENDHVYIVLSGRLRAHLHANDAKPIALFGLGECVGEMSMFNDNQVSAYVIAATECELLSLPHPEVWAILNESLQASHNMLTILANRMRSSNRMMAESTEPEENSEALEYIDTVTGLHNRRWLSENVERLIHRNILNQQPSSFILLKAENFEQYGSHFGSLGSEQAQLTIAQTILRCLRPNDVAAHLSEDQFAVFLPRTKPDNASAVIARLQEEIGLSAIVTPGGDALPSITLLIGTTQANASDTLDDLLERAAASLSKA